MRSVPPGVSFGRSSGFAEYTKGESHDWVYGNESPGDADSMGFSPTTARDWWERSVLYNRSDGICMVEPGGKAGYYFATGSFCVSPCFSIG